MRNTSAGRHQTVSVILPTFNRSHLLVQVLATIADQDYPKDSYEIIVVDNNSSDDTEAVAVRFGQTAEVDFKYVKDKRQGLAFTRHTGAVHARGEILVFGDDDALYERNWISAILDVYEKHSDVGAVGTTIRVKWDKEPESWVKRYEGYLGDISYGPTPVVKLGLTLNGGSCSIRKSVLYSVKGFNPGQRGDYILGDSEVGLCRKLAACGVAVGGTSATTAWHMQFREKHGTFEDLKRRFQNNGICQAYADTFYSNKLWTVLYDTFRQAGAIGRAIARRLVTAEMKTLRIDALLQLNEFYHRVKYLVLYRCDSQIRREISKNDWELSPAYEAPDAVYARTGIMRL
jgi:glucosyl-dolichyl phosphate glucuronosyltransferase